VAGAVQTEQPADPETLRQFVEANAEEINNGLIPVKVGGAGFRTKAIEIVDVEESCFALKGSPRFHPLDELDTTYTRIF
jgi:hypothetical protein